MLTLLLQLHNNKLKTASIISKVESQVAGGKKW